MASEDISGIERPDSVSTMDEGAETVFLEEYHNKFSAQLVTFRKLQRLTDVTLKCKDEEFCCHRLILAAASSYFETMFYSTGFKENNQDVIDLVNMDPNVLSNIINFIYTAKVKLSIDNVQNICAAADELELVELKKGCDVFMSQRVEPANCLGLYMFAKQYNLRAALKECKDCMLTKLEDILDTSPDSEFQILGEDELKEYISSDDLGVEEEATVFKLVEKWIHVDCENRSECVDRLIGYVRLPLCSPQKLLSDIRQSPLMQSMKGPNLVMDALSYQHMPEKRQYIVNARRRSEQQLLLFGVNMDAQSKSWFFDCHTSQWNEFTSLPMPELQNARACVCGTDIILTGGGPQYPFTNAAWAFCLLTKKWRTMPAMKNKLSQHAVVSVGNEVFVIGGYDGNRCIDEVEKLDAKRKAWSQMAAMKKALKDHMAVNIDESIFVLGGNPDWASTAMTQKYDLKSGEWEIKMDMPQACSNVSAVVFNNTIYVVGGQSQCCMTYDPAQDTWTTLCGPQYARKPPAAAIWQGKIVLIGGQGRNDVEEYDMEKHTWTSWQASLPSIMSYHTLLSVNKSFN